MKQQSWITVLITLVVVLFISTAYAQDNEQCTTEFLNEQLPLLSEALEDAKVSIDDGDFPTAIQKLGDLGRLLSSYQVICGEMAFNGSNGKVLGPVEIPAGIYRAVVTTDDFITVDVTLLEGECGAGSGDYLSDLLFALTSGEATSGSEAVFTSKDCSALLEISSVEGEWALTFEKLK